MVRMVACFAFHVLHGELTCDDQAGGRAKRGKKGLRVGAADAEIGKGLAVDRDRNMIVIYILEFDLRAQSLRSSRQQARSQKSGRQRRQSDLLHNRSKS